MAANPETLADFFAQVRNANPFSRNRVDGPGKGDDVDVDTIHLKPFAELSFLAELAYREKRGLGVVVWGTPGIGKSHFLTRLCRSRDPAYCLFLHNLQTAPEQIPHYILKCVLSRLAPESTSGYADAPLYQLVKKTAQSSLQEWHLAQDPVVVETKTHWPTRWLRKIRRWLTRMDHQPSAPKPTSGGHISIKMAYDRKVERFLQENNYNYPADRDICHMLFRFLTAVTRRENHQAHLAVRWLAGDHLHPQELEMLEVGAEDGWHHGTGRWADTQMVERVLVILIQLVRVHEQPFILCFDQVDNMSATQISAWSRFLHALIDHATNLFVVTSGTQQKLEFMFDELGSSKDRIAEKTIQLDSIIPDEARELIAARLRKFWQPFRELPPAIQVLSAKDPWFPLNNAWFAKKTQNRNRFNPREIIRWADQRWNEELAALHEVHDWLQTWPHNDVGPSPPVLIETLIDDLLARKIQEYVDQRQEDPTGLPPDACNIGGLVATLLGHCLDSTQKRYLQAVDPVANLATKEQFHVLVTDKQGIRTSVVVIVTSDALATTKILKNLVLNPQPLERMVLVTDARHGLKFGAAPNAKGREHFQTLTNRGAERFRHWQLSFSEYCQLDALQSVLDAARSGDLEVMLPKGQLQAVSEAEVIASHHRCDRYGSQPFLGEFFQENQEKPPETSVAVPRLETPVAPPQPATAPSHQALPVDKDDLRQYINAQLALTMGLSSEEVANKYGNAKKVAISMVDLQQIVRDVAEEMHREGLIQAKPSGKQLFLHTKN